MYVIQIPKWPISKRNKKCAILMSIMYGCWKIQSAVWISCFQLIEVFVNTFRSIFLASCVAKITLEIFSIDIWVKCACFLVSIMKVKSLKKGITVFLSKYNILYFDISYKKGFTSHFGFRLHIFMQSIGRFWPKALAFNISCILNRLLSLL